MVLMFHFSYKKERLFKERWVLCQASNVNVLETFVFVIYKSKSDKNIHVQSVTCHCSLYLVVIVVVASLVTEASQPIQV